MYTKDGEPRGCTSLRRRLQPQRQFSNCAAAHELTSSSRTEQLGLGSTRTAQELSSCTRRGRSEPRGRTSLRRHVTPTAKAALELRSSSRTAHQLSNCTARVGSTRTAQQFSNCRRRGRSEPRGRTSPRRRVTPTAKAVLELRSNSQTARLGSGALELHSSSQAAEDGGEVSLEGAHHCGVVSNRKGSSRTGSSSDQQLSNCTARVGQHSNCTTVLKLQKTGAK